MKYTVTFTNPPGQKSRYRHALKLLGAESVRIVESEEQAGAAKTRPDNLPTSPEAMAVASLYGRKLDRPWADEEIAVFRKARTRGIITIENMTIIANHYRTERRKSEHCCRRDMLTFLRHVDGELDRARAARPSNRALEWSDSSKVVPMPVQSEEERARIVAAAKADAAKLREGIAS